jgi:hypothetical protein
MEKSMAQVLMRFEADYDVVLECIQEVYGLECDNLRLGKEFRRTMVLPFMKMLERHCSGIRMENLHKVLWEVYQEDMGGKNFLEKTEIILKPYYREISSSEQNVCV